MSKVLTDLETVKLTVSSQRTVWYLDGYGLPQDSGIPVNEFIFSDIQAGNRCVRVVGLARNAPLLKRLYRMPGVKTLEVCSPLCCPSIEQRNDPGQLLISSRTYERPRSVGGWHTFTEGDLAHYTLADRYYHPEDYKKTDPAAVHMELLQHPAWPAMSFISHLNWNKLVELLGLLIDPRWYVDPSDPDKTSKLPQYLGLDPRAQNSNADKNERSARNHLVTETWRNGDPAGPFIAPGHFLWRTWHAKGGGTKGDLAVSKRFIEYLRQNWLAALCPTAQASHLFVPEYFFDKDTQDAEGYRNHMKPQ